MAEVYKAFDPTMDRLVALKLLDLRSLKLPNPIEFVLREARAIGRLSHPNITSVYDVGRENGRFFLVMEYLSGRDLETLIYFTGKLTLLKKLDIAIQIAEGLAHAHSRDVIHRDVKPKNIIVLEDERVKIIDFGIAKFASNAVTLSRGQIGSPYYMSPEQAVGKTVDHRTDIFSFGAVLFELLFGRVPFDGSDPNVVINKIVNAAPDWATENNKLRPPALKDIIERCLRKRPEQRFQTFDEIVAVLDNVHTVVSLIDDKIGTASDLNFKTPAARETENSCWGQDPHSGESSIKKTRLLPRQNIDLRPRRQSTKTALAKSRFYHGRLMIAGIAIIVVVLLLLGGLRSHFFAAKPNIGHVSMSIAPWAEITEIIALDETGQRRTIEVVARYTPCFLTLPEGKYLIRLKHPDFEEWSITVEVEGNQLLQIKESIPGYEGEKNAFKL